MQLDTSSVIGRLMIAHISIRLRAIFRDEMDDGASASHTGMLSDTEETISGTTIP